MRAYRLEIKSGLGPFTSGIPIPSFWYDSHEPPSYPDHVAHKQYCEWVSENFNEPSPRLPWQVHFAFDSLKNLNKYLPDWESVERLNLYVLELNPEEDDFLVLPDGQVLYSSATSKELYKD